MSKIKDEINNLKVAFNKEYPDIKVDKESERDIKDFFRINEVKVDYQVTLAEDGLFRVIFDLPSMLNRGEKIAFTFLGDDKMNYVAVLWQDTKLVPDIGNQKSSSYVLNLPCMLRVLNWKFIQ